MPNARPLTSAQIAALKTIAVEATNTYAVEFGAPLQDDLNVEGTVRELATEVEELRALVAEQRRSLGWAERVYRLTQATSHHA